MNRATYILNVVLLQGCFQELDPDLAKQFPDYPNHDFDGDGLLDAEDCDDSDPNIRACGQFKNKCILVYFSTTFVLKIPHMALP